MTKDDTLRLALEALEDLGNHDRICPQWPTYAEPENYPKCNCGYDQAITAIKAALEAKDEPVALKPCAYESKEKKMCRKCGQVHAEAIWDTTPPQRTWVGLTDEHKEGLICMTDPNPEPHHLRELIDVVEFQLKEKNT